MVTWQKGFYWQCAEVSRAAGRDTTERTRTMLDWNGYRQQLVKTVGEVARLSRRRSKGYHTLSALLAD
jgi:hypothetical protein